MASSIVSGDGPLPSYLLRSLERLPNELLVPIVAALAPTSPLTTRFALRSTGTWEFRDAKHQWQDWLVGHRDVLAVAQTSQRMASIAKPLLYHTLVIPNPKSLVTLYRRLHFRPEIRPWIRDLTCLVNVAGSRSFFDVFEEWWRQNGGRTQPNPCSSPSAGSTMVNRTPESWGVPYLKRDSAIALEVLKRILLHSPNLRNLLIAFPDHELINQGATGQNPDISMPLYRQRILQHLSNPDDHWNWIDLPIFFPFHHMKNLRSLRIYCHREDGVRDITFSRLLSDYAVALLPQLTNLRTLELCCSSANNFANEQEILLPPLPHIQHLRFYGSHIHEPRLVAFCLACVSLQTLVVHFESSSPDEDRDLLPEGKTLSDALAGLADTLETLELVALSEGHYLTRGRERPRKPENHRLRCIPDLVNLKSLTLDYRGVFGTLGILEEDDGERLCQLLPYSLQDFTLVCEWGTANDWKQSYMANLDMVLHGVQCLCDCRSPSLESISLAIHSWPAEGKFHRRFRREVEAAFLRCASVGIKFRTFDLLPTYRDEDEDDGDPEGEGEEELEDDEDSTEDEVAASQPPLSATIPATAAGLPLVAGVWIPPDDEEEYELEEEDEASEYYFSGDEEPDPERAARRPPTFEAFVMQLGEDHGHNLDDLFYAYHEDRWDEYLF